MLQSGQTPENPLIGPGSNNYGRASGFFSRKDVGGYPDHMLKEQLRKATENLKSPVTSTRNWEILAFDGNSIEPKTIKRLSDNIEFSLGDYVTNGSQMKGHIQKFHYNFKGDDIYVITDWSGIGFDLDSLQHTSKLPSAHQLGTKVRLEFGSECTLKDCEIIKVHFTESKVFYDVIVRGVYEWTHGTPTGTWNTRLYNVDSAFVSPTTSGITTATGTTTLTS